MRLLNGFLLIAVAVLMLVPGAPMESGAAEVGIIDKAKDLLAIWQSRPAVLPAPSDCDRCFHMYERLQGLEAKGKPLATEMQVLLQKGGSDLAGAQLKQLQEAADSLEAVIMERKSLVYQYDNANAEYKRFKDRPDDKKAREELRYTNPMRVR